MTGPYRRFLASIDVISRSRPRARARPALRPGARGWQKLRTRLTAEAVIGGVIGPLDAPRVLLGRHDTDGRLHLVGRTTELPPAGREKVAALLSSHTGAGHPWPNPLPSTPLGPARSGHDLHAGGAEGGRGADRGHRGRASPVRHPAHFLRVRPDLGVGDLAPLPASAPASALRVQPGTARAG